MAVATASVGAAALGNVPSADSAPGDGPFRTTLEDGTPIVSGIVGTIDEESVVLEGDAPAVELDVTEAEVWRDGASTVRSLRPGDYVVAKGTWQSDNRFAATEVSPTYFNLSGTVHSSNGDVLATTGGAVRVTEATRILESDGTLVATSADDFPPGAQLAVMARRGGSDPAYVAVRIQVI